MKPRIQSYLDSAEVQRTGPDNAGFVQFAYRPFDTRWLYWEANGGLLDRPRPEYKPHIVDGNLWLSSAQHLRKGAEEPQTWFTQHIGSLHLIERGANMFPAWLRDEGLALDGGGAQRRPNLSAAARRYLDQLGLGVEDLFHHALAVLHDPAYRAANAGALRMEWPRIPLPGWPDGDAPGAAEDLLASAAKGRDLAALLDPETPVGGVTAGALRPELAAIAVPSTARRTQHERRRLRADRRLGAPRNRRRRDARARAAPWSATTPPPMDWQALGNAVAVLSAPPRFDVHLNANASLAQRTRRRVELQAGRLPGPQEVAVLPGKQGVGPQPAA